MLPPDAENARRTARYRKDPALEAALAAANDRLAIALEETADRFDGRLLLVIGSPRSGTTLLTQLLARTRDLTYPDHVVARFPGAPALGVLASRSLRVAFPSMVEAVEASDAPARSDHGVTPGLFEPHEAGYFWSRHFDFSRGHELDASAFSAVRWPALFGALSALQAAGDGRPLMFKTVPLAMNIDEVAARLPGALVLVTRRDPLDVALSVYRARIARYGDAGVFWSVAPRGHEEMAARPPVESIGAQIAGFLRAMDAALSRVPAERRFELDHAALVSSPSSVLGELD